jgi:murein L,D-transpeptidase YcbB/YkuD
MEAGLTAVIAAAVGALGGIAGGWVTGRGQDRQQDRRHSVEERIRREETRRQAYRDFLAASKHLSAYAWKLTDRLWEEGTTPEQWQASFSELHAAWEAFSTAEAAVSIAGPAPVAEAAHTLRRAMRDMEMAATRWHQQAIRQGEARLEDCNQDFLHAAQAKRAPDRAFLAAARRALNAED